MAHGQAPGVRGAPSPARSIPPHPSHHPGGKRPHRNITHLSPKQRAVFRLPASQVDSASLPPRARCSAERMRPGPRQGGRPGVAHHGAGGAGTATSRGWARLLHHLPLPPPSRVAPGGSQWRARQLPEEPMTGAATACSSNQRWRRGCGRPRARGGRGTAPPGG